VPRRTSVTETEFFEALAARFSLHGHDAEEKLGLLKWGRKYLPHHFVDAPSRMHEWVAKKTDKKFDRRGSKLLLIGPRGGAKSTTGTLACTLKRACQRAENYILICSDTASQAKEHLRTIKEELETNDELAEKYPRATGIGPIWRENYIQMRNGVTVQAVGTLSRIRGLRRRQHRPSLIILDDPENDQHVSSTIMRNRTQLWFYKTLMNMGTSETNFLVMGTAIHREGLVMSLMQKPGWETFVHNGKRSAFKAILEWPERMDLWSKWEDIYHDVDNGDSRVNARKFFKQNEAVMLKGAEVLWPAREPLYKLMRIRAEIGHQHFEGEKQSNPINPETCEWPSEYFTGDDIWFDNWPKNLAIKTMALDPSKGKDAKRSDYSAIVKLGVSPQGIWYVDANIKRRSTDIVTADTVTETRAFAPEKLGIEINQFQSLLAEEITDEFSINQVNCEIVELDNRANKRLRIRRISPLLARRRFRFKKKSPGVSLLLQQLRDFPNGDFDDGPDALEMATRLAADEIENFGPDDMIGGTINAPR
jgi:predicted phage terminase large subunit-like protein